MRIIHNTTFHVEEEIEEAFKKAIREGYIPYVKSEGLCRDVLFSRILVNEEEGKSFSLQLLFPDADDYAAFMEIHEEKVPGIWIETLGFHLLHFSTTLEEV